MAELTPFKNGDFATAGEWSRAGRRKILRIAFDGVAARSASSGPCAADGFARVVFISAGFSHLAIDGGDKPWRWFERQDASRRDRIFMSGLWIASDAGTLRPYVECAEAAQFHGFSVDQRSAQSVEDRFYDIFRFDARKSRPRYVDDLQQVCSRQSSMRHFRCPSE